jgi:hypothetical protein
LVYNLNLLFVASSIHSCPPIQALRPNIESNSWLHAAKATQLLLLLCKYFIICSCMKPKFLEISFNLHFLKLVCFKFPCLVFHVIKFPYQDKATFHSCCCRLLLVARFRFTLNGKQFLSQLSCFMGSLNALLFSLYGFGGFNSLISSNHWFVDNILVSWLFLAAYYIFQYLLCLWLSASLR